MIQHKKTYENVFSTDIIKGRAPLRVENLSAVDMEFNDYTSFFKSFLNNFYSDLFLNCVKLSWLRRKFVFYGKRYKVPIHERNSPGVHIVFNKLMRRVIGKDIQLITKSPFFTKLEMYYFDAFFPGFSDGDPFKNPDYYKFPYKNISLEYLLVVYQLDERIEILEFAEKEKMSFAVFLDYVNNHVLCENDRLDREKYSLKSLQRGPSSKNYYVCDNDKIYNFNTKKGGRRYK